MLRSFSKVWLALIVVLLGVWSGRGTAAPEGSTRRGLDVFVHAPLSAAVGAAIPVQVVAYGFPDVLTMTPLAGVTVDAAWDPQTLGGAAPPPPATATTDARGRASLQIEMPPGEEGDLSLVVGVRDGERRRVREVAVRRLASVALALYLADDRVVPGSDISTWVIAQDAVTSAPLAGMGVEIALQEGGVDRQRVRVRTDAAGAAAARIHIPFTDEPAWRWNLVARTVAPAAIVRAERMLEPRDETPGFPRLAATWEEAWVPNGATARYRVLAVDASDEPIPDLPILVWTGAAGVDVPADDKTFAAAARRVVTDARGIASGQLVAPETLAPGTTTSLQLVARGRVEGRPIESATSLEVGGPGSARVELAPEGGALIPGAKQRMLVRVLDDRDRPVSGGFTVEADGLSQPIDTGAQGEAEIAWSVPAEVGAHREVGPCAGGVAASVVVRPRGPIPALRDRTQPFVECVDVDRDRTHLLVAPPFARAGDAVKVAVVAAGAKGPSPAASGFSVIASSSDGAVHGGGFVDAGSGEITLPAGAFGVFPLSAVAPHPDRAADRATGAILVLPRVLPKLGARVAGGRAAPGGTVQIEAHLTDETGRGIPGSVAAILVDAYGGGTVAGFEAFDTRGRLCSAVGVEPDRCDAFLGSDPALDPLRRAALAAPHTGIDPASDPGGTARAELDAAFATVLRSLEGAVFESTSSPERLRDASRRVGGGWGFNPELMTLATAALAEPALTPGGEPVELGDLLRVDPQVTFDNVARRVTRLKLFRVLSAVRSFKHEHQLDPDEPVLRDPPALLRRLVRDGTLTQDQLLDPWGGTLDFVRQNGAGLPFITPIPGFALASPGPDGRRGTGDDVDDPFERVVSSQSPYARALTEDAVVDARLDMRVGEETVGGWASLLEASTGTALGSGTGTGQGFGSGHGRLGGSHTAKAPKVRMGATTTGYSVGAAYWSPPKRTDADGKVVIDVPLGRVETTWRIALVGIPDHAPPATASVDVPVSAPLSALVDSGSRWTVGDRAAVRITLRNRTDRPLDATVAVAASGALSLDEGARAKVSARIPAGSRRELTVPVATPRPGDARLRVTTSAAGAPTDVLDHAWTVTPAGRPMTLARARWVDDDQTIPAVLGDAGERPTGPAHLVLERGRDRAMLAALSSLEPDRIRSPDALAWTIEAAARAERWALAQGGQGDPLAARARATHARATGRLLALFAQGEPRWSANLRARAWATADGLAAFPEGAPCPPEETSLPLADYLFGLPAEPPPEGGAVTTCWNVFSANALQAVADSDDPVAVARALLAAADRPHRRARAVALADRLREMVALDERGNLSLPSRSTADREARSIVYAALAGSTSLGRGSPAPRDLLIAWLSVQRDPYGGYGSALATAAAMEAFAAATPPSASPTRVFVDDGTEERAFDVRSSDRRVVPLAAGAEEVRIRVEGPGVLTRIEQPALRLWSAPPDPSKSPLRLSLEWPAKPRVGRSDTLLVRLHSPTGEEGTALVRIPLPPGVELAGPLEGARVVHGVLTVRTDVPRASLPALVEVPLRFRFAGRVTAPEAHARRDLEESIPAVAPARGLVIGR